MNCDVKKKAQYDSCYAPWEDGETLLKATAQVKMIHTARAMLEADQRAGRGVGLKCRGGQQAQVSVAALPQLPPSLRGILLEKTERNNREVSAS